MTISSNTLFHFTKTKENLISILKEGFKICNSKEDKNFLYPGEPTEDDKEELQIAIPMVCFCDIPLSQSKKHMSSYGEYGIGLNKDWGKRNSISPVLYTHENSKFVSVLKQIMLNHFNNHDESEFKEFSYNLYPIYCVTKEYEGEFSGNKICFYDEREWRYVPSLKDLHEHSKKIREPDKSHNPKQNDLKNLIFKASDIKYIIVSSEKQIIPFINVIEKINRFNEYEKKLLYTKIISVTQIDEDF